MLYSQLRSCQESSSEILIEIETLLNYVQILFLVPSTEAYIPDDTLILYEHCLQNLSSISGLAEPPEKIIRWDSHSQAFIRMMVYRHVVFPLYNLHFLCYQHMSSFF